MDCPHSNFNILDSIYRFGECIIFSQRSLIFGVEHFENLKLVQREIDNSPKIIRSLDNGVYGVPEYSQHTTAWCMIQNHSENRGVALLSRFRWNSTNLAIVSAEIPKLQE